MSIRELEMLLDEFVCCMWQMRILRAGKVVSEDCLILFSFSLYAVGTN